MKVTMPKEITELSVRIDAARSEVETTRADIQRAEQAVQQAEGIAAEIEAVSSKRAEQKALAFVSRQPADLAELDRQMADLERANRSALEDGTAAAMATAMLAEKLAQQESTVAELDEARRSLAIAWLEDRREKAIDRYIKALVDLGPIVAEAMAADRARVSLGNALRQYGIWLRDSFKTNAPPMPHHKMLPNKFIPTLPVYPVSWLRDSTHGDAEHEQFIAELKSAGLLPDDIGGGHG